MENQKTSNQSHNKPMNHNRSKETSCQSKNLSSKNLSSKKLSSKKLSSKQFLHLLIEYPGHANQYFLSICHETKSIGEINELIKLGINLKNNDLLDRAFIASCCVGNMDIVTFFLKEGADINALEGQALVRVVEYKHWNILQMLLDKGIKITKYNIVHISYQPEYKIALEMILNFGIDKSIITKLLIEGLVKHQNHINTINLLIDNNIKIDGIIKLIKNDNDEKEKKKTEEKNKN